MASTRDEYIKAIDDLKANAPAGSGAPAKRTRFEILHTHLIEDLEKRIETIDAELAVSSPDTLTGRPNSDLFQRIERARKRVVQRNILLAQAEVRGPRTRRQAHRPDYVDHYGLSDVSLYSFVVSVVWIWYYRMKNKMNTSTRRMEIKMTTEWMRMKELGLAREGRAFAEMPKGMGVGMWSYADPLGKRMGNENQRLMMISLSGEENDGRADWADQSIWTWTSSAKGNAQGR